MNFLLCSQNAQFIEIFSRNAHFIWKDCAITASHFNEVDASRLQDAFYQCVFIDATESAEDCLAWYSKQIQPTSNTPAIFITAEKDTAFAKQVAAQGIKAVLAKTELTKKKIQNAVDRVLLVPDSTVEVTDSYYVDDQYSKPRLKGYRVENKLTDLPESWSVEKRDIGTHAEVYIFDYFSKIEAAEPAKAKFQCLLQYENKHVIPILDAGLLPGHVGKIYLVQKTFTQDLRQITPGSMSLNLTLQSLITSFKSLNKLHALGFVCGFLHPDYFFLDKHNQVVISLAPMLAYPQKRKSLYASPERRRGDALDYRADYYSLAAVFHYFLTGKAPVVGQEIGYSSEFSRLEKIIDAALSPSVDKRYKSFKEFMRFVEIKCANILQTS